MACGPITSWQIDAETMETVTDFIFLGSKITADGDCSHEIKRRLLLGKNSYDQPRQCTKKQRHYFASKGPSSQSYGFSSSHVWMWELDHKEGWTLKNWCFLTVVLEKTLESLLDCKETKLVNSKGNQSWIFIGQTDAEAEVQIIWPPDTKSQLTGKDPDTGMAEEGDDRGWNGWMTSPIQWTWVWASSRRWWRTGKPGVLQSKGLQRVGQDWATEQQPAVCKEPNVEQKTRSQCRVTNGTLGVSPGSGTKESHISTALSADHQGKGSFLCLRPCWAP